MRYFMLAASLLLLSPTLAWADDDQALENRCKISRARAQQIALSRVVGNVTDVDVERGADGKIYWSIDVKPNGGTEKEIHIDGDSGAIVSVTNDND